MEAANATQLVDSKIAALIAHALGASPAPAGDSVLVGDGLVVCPSTRRCESSRLTEYSRHDQPAVLFRSPLLGVSPALTRWRDPVYLGRALAAHDCLEVAHSPASTVGGCVHGGRQLSALLERSRRAPCRWPSRHDYSYLFHEAIPGATSPGGRDSWRLLARDLPLPSIARLGSLAERDLTVARLYAGAALTGSYLHWHAGALNYLAAGAKLWLVAPRSSSGGPLRRFTYGRVSNMSTHRWLRSALPTLFAVPRLALFVQRAGEAVYVPPYAPHAVVNLEYNVGATFTLKAAEPSLPVWLLASLFGG